MKTKNIEVCDAVLYEVSCKENDIVDIRCGGPRILGYDFGVSPDNDKKEMIEHIKSCIKKYNRPFMGISTRVVKNFPVENLWDKEKIETCIKKNGVW